MVRRRASAVSNHEAAVGISRATSFETLAAQAPQDEVIKPGYDAVGLAVVRSESRRIPSGRGRGLNAAAMRLRRKKAPDHAGAFVLLIQQRSVLRDHRAGPVEAINQRRADGLVPSLKGGRSSGRQAGRDNSFRKGNAAIVGGAVLGLHEQARNINSEDVEIVLDAAADKETVTAEGVRRSDRRAAKTHARKRGTGPLRAGIAAIYVGKHIRGNQVAQPHASRIAGPKRLRARQTGKRIANIATNASELAVGQYAGYPAAVELPVVSGADGPEPAASTIPLTSAEGNQSSRGYRAVVSIPQPAAGTAEDVEAGPAWSRRDIGGSLGIVPGREVSR